MKVKYAQFRQHAAKLLSDGRPRFVGDIIEAVPLRNTPTPIQAALVMRWDERFTYEPPMKHAWKNGYQHRPSNGRWTLRD